MLDVYKTILNSDEALYCSSPVTSGRRYIEWLKRIGKEVADIDGLTESDRKSHFTKVVEPNCVHARRIVQRLRKQTGRVVIDPTAMPSLPNWTQQDWRFYWRQVLERYATTALFVDDWQYSNGCVYEFWVAQTKGIRTIDEEMRPLDLLKGKELITDAVVELKRYDASTPFIEQVLRDLESLSPMPAKPDVK